MQNLEAKFKLYSLERAAKAAGELKYEFQAILHQRDTFFRAKEGKLKLREEEAGAALIYYGREDSKGLKLSNYEIVAIAEPERTRAMLSDAFGVLAIVKKERMLLLRRNVRLHLDRIDGLGDFGEIEAVLNGGDPEHSRPDIEELLTALEVNRKNLIGASYYEMLRPMSDRLE